MHFGHYISGFAHLGLLTGLFVGPVFQKELDPIEYSSVSLISEQEFIDLTASNILPAISADKSPDHVCCNAAIIYVLLLPVFA